MYCKYCGIQIDDDAKFCSKCGHEQHKPVEEQSKTATQNTGIVQQPITSYSCPKCGCTDFRTSRTNADRINRVRICVNCNNSYRTERDIDEDVEYCKNSIIGLTVCAVVLVLIFIFLANIFDVGYTLEHWRWASDSKKESVYLFFVIVIIGCFAVIPGFIKRSSEIDSLNVEKERVLAEYSIARKKNEKSSSSSAPSRCPDCDTKIYPNTHICPSCGRKL